MARSAQKVFLAALVAWGVLLGLGGGMSPLPLQAQEGRPPVFGPRDVLPMFFRALQTADLLILRDGSVASGSLPDRIPFEPLAGERRDLDREELVAVVLADPEEATDRDRVYLQTGERLTGTLNLEAFRMRLELGDSVETKELPLDREQVKAVLLRLPGRGGLHRISPAAFQQVFGLFNDLLVSVTKYDLLVFPTQRVASVVFEDRADLAFTLESPIFGTFTFAARQLAAVFFGQEEGDPDQLLLQNGDRVSGRVTAQEDVRGTLAAWEGVSFSFSKEGLREELRQIVFRMPVRLFGGGGGRPVGPREGD